LDALVHNATAAVASETGVLVEPRVLAAIMANLSLFTSNICYPPNSTEGRENCRKTVYSDMLRREIRAFVTEAAEVRPRSIVSVAARLSASVGIEFTRTGWPASIENDLGVVRLPESAVGARISVITASGTEDLGTGSRILAYPGRYRFLVSRGSSRSAFSADVVARSVVSVGSDSESSTLGAVTPPRSAFCYDLRGPRSGLPTFDHPTVNFNWGRSTFSEPEAERARQQAPITTRVGLDIQVVDETGTACGAQCRLGFGVAFAESLSVWRSGCGRCDDNALSVIRLGETVWLDSRIVSRLKRRPIGGAATPSLDLSRQDPTEGEQLQSPPSLGVPIKPIVGYVQANTDQALRSALCGLPAGAAPWLPEAAAFLCGRSAVALRVVSPVVRLRAGDTSCGPSADYLGCGTPNAGVELTLAGARYIVPTPGGEVRIGSGEQFDLFGVTLHEVGHWFGVPHSEIVSDLAKDIMSELYDPKGKRCVSADSLAMMNNAADLRWKYRVAKGGGLRRPPRKPGGVR